MPSHALTDISIRALTPPAKGQTTHWDVTTTGFGVRVSQGGTKTFVVVHGSERRRYSLGRFPTISLKQARDQAKQLQAGLTLGLIEKRPSPPFQDALNLYLEVVSQKNRPRTVFEYQRLLTSHFAFGRKRLSEISRADIQAKLNRIKDRPSEQRHALVALKVFLNWAVRDEHLDANPIASLQPATRQRSRERVLQPEELTEIFKKAGKRHWPYGAIVQLLILTGQRRSEIGALQWSWIDRDKRLITYPAEFTKNRRTHVLPYGEKTAAIINNLPEHVDSDFVFPGGKPNAKHFNGWSKSKRSFDTTLEGVDPYVLHDLRRTYSSTLAQLGTPIHVTEKLLNHVSGTISGVAAIYNRHSYLDEMRGAVEAFEKYLSEVCGF